MPSRTSEQAAGRCSPHPLPCESSPTPLRSQQGGPPELSCPTHAAPPGATFNFRKAGLIIPVCVFTTGRFESSPASNSRSPHLAWRLASSRMQSLSRHSTPGERFHFPSRRREARSIASPKPLSPPPSRFDHLDNLRASLRAGESTSQALAKGSFFPSRRRRRSIISPAKTSSSTPSSPVAPSMLLYIHRGQRHASSRCILSICPWLSPLRISPIRGMSSSATRTV
mmetsp:Transcript_64596/g.203895  ORF Transcript_64596/g.203895 Transcript_64596/m.203895 type:complete len:226 (-) Transcript_64596:270-947(-)